MGCGWAVQAGWGRGGESKQPVGRCRWCADSTQQAGPRRRWPGWNEGVKGEDGELGWQPTVEARALL